MVEAETKIQSLEEFCSVGSKHVRKFLKYMLPIFSSQSSVIHYSVVYIKILFTRNATFLFFFAFIT